jgi:ribosomal protein S18 acetylase RimI-like enzyme
MAAHPDYLAQRVLRDNAFHGREEANEEESRRRLPFYNYAHHGPLYHAPTDLCVMAPDGRFAAGCEALIDGHNSEADIERVCTHSDFRRQGFARAVIAECLRRLKEMGLRNAYITGYSEAALALYGSMGAVDETPAYVYTKSA